jgi:hypothetical protein
MPMNLPQLFATVVLIASTQSALAQETKRIRFSPDGSRHAVVTVSHQTLTVQWSPQRKGGTASIALDTEMPIAIKVEDYNFDGYKDFSISSVDEGKGTYDIYRIFAYSASDQKFVEMRPACGDGFINVRINKKSRMLTNSYYSDNVIKACTKKY